MFHYSITQNPCNFTLFIVLRSQWFLTNKRELKAMKMFCLLCVVFLLTIPSSAGESGQNFPVFSEQNLLQFRLQDVLGSITYPVDLEETNMTFAALLLTSISFGPEKNTATFEVFTPHNERFHIRINDRTGTCGNDIEPPDQGEYEFPIITFMRPLRTYEVCEIGVVGWIVFDDNLDFKDFVVLRPGARNR